jgi:hypothetical protein
VRLAAPMIVVGTLSADFGAAGRIIMLTVSQNRRNHLRLLVFICGLYFLSAV